MVAAEPAMFWVRLLCQRLPQPDECESRLWVGLLLHMFGTFGEDDLACRSYIGFHKMFSMSSTVRPSYNDMRVDLRLLAAQRNVADQG